MLIPKKNRLVILQYLFKGSFRLSNLAHIQCALTKLMLLPYFCRGCSRHEEGPCAYTAHDPSRSELARS